MFVSMYTKNPLFGFQNKATDEYIKQSQNNYINLIFKCNEERRIKKICGLDNPQLPPPSKKEFIISSVILLSLSTTLYYFYSSKK